MFKVPSPGSLGEPKIYHHLVYFTRKTVVGFGGLPDFEELVGIDQMYCAKLPTKDQ